MNILLTGGLGTIGSYLSAKLFFDGHSITIVDNMEIGHIDNLKFYLNEEQIKKITIVNKDILDLDILKYLINKADIVYHLAATLGTLNVVEQPLRMLRVNSSGTHNIVDYCVFDKKPLVIMSTSMVYGRNPKEKVNEDDDLFVEGNTKVGLWWYAVSKMSDEAYANATLLENHNAKILTIRPFNVIAPHQRHEVGFVIPRFFKAAYEGKDIEVYGDGSQQRTFTWAEDFVHCLTSLVEKNIWRETFNIGGTESISILELAKKIKDVTNSTSEIVCINPAKLFNDQFVEIDQRVPDVQKLEKYIGTSPETSLDKMLENINIFYSKIYN